MQTMQKKLTFSKIHCKYLMTTKVDIVSPSILEYTLEQHIV